MVNKTHFKCFLVTLDLLFCTILRNFFKSNSIQQYYLSLHCHHFFKWTVFTVTGLLEVGLLSKSVALQRKMKRCGDVKDVEGELWQQRWVTPLIEVAALPSDQRSDRLSGCWQPTLHAPLLNNKDVSLLNLANTLCIGTHAQAYCYSHTVQPCIQT